MTIYGWDMSHFDAPGIGSALVDGIEFVTHKAGGDRNDAELGAWWQEVRGLGPAVLLGAYWVLYPGNPRGRADAFIARLDDQCPGWRLRPFILQVDCERWNGDPGTVPDRAEIKAFCDRLVELCPRLRPIVYAPKWVYGDKLTGLGYPLWASSYVDGAGGFKRLYPGDGSSRWGAYSGQTPAILQYTSSATIGGQSTCDANAYRGTLAELTALVAPGWEDDMPSVEEIWNQDGIVTNPDQRGDAKTNPTVRAAFAVGDTWQQVYNLRDQVGALGKSLAAAITALAAKDQVDETVLAAQLIPGVVAGVLAALPPGVEVTAEQLQTAIVGALRELAAPAA